MRPLEAEPHYSAVFGGVAWTPDEPRSLDMLLAEADMAAYTAKRRRQHG